MAKSKTSLFWINVILQSLLSSFITGAAWHFRYGSAPAIGVLLFTIAKVLGFTSGFGIVYGVFRFFGVRGEALENFYGNFPIKSSSNEETAKSSQSDEIIQAAEVANQKDKREGFNWDNLFSAHYLRYAGLLLVVSAIFSFLFKIEWELSHKIMASFAGGILGLVLSEVFHRKGTHTVSGIFFLLGFSAIQFGITLSGKYCLINEQINPNNLLVGILSVKMLLCAGFLPLLFRYEKSFYPSVYILIAYVGLISISKAGIAVGLVPGGVYILLISAVALLISCSRFNAGLSMVNSFCANFALIYILNGVDFVKTGLLSFTPEDALNALIFTFAVYFFHLANLIYIELRAGKESEDTRHIHSILAHALLTGIVLWLAPNFESLAGQKSLILLVLSIFPMTAHFYLKIRDNSLEKNAGLMPIAVFMATIGLLGETNGPWASVVFLFYACLLLWYGLTRKDRAMRIFSFLVLTASLFKLYTESSELFESISGTSVILVIGIILLVLANKMEQIKELIKKA